MFTSSPNNATVNTTSWKVVLPFYLYAAISFLAATVLLFLAADDFTAHYFQPHTLAVTHAMALGWGTMIILGASHQLVPVIIEGKLYSTKLAYISFALAALGIPLLLYGFYFFDMGEIAKCGGTLVLLSILSYIINLGKSIAGSQSKNVHAVFVFTASLWLFITALLGLALLFNFTGLIMPDSSLHYLPLHAHLGIVGWFLLLVMGVGTRLIPMFLISKYNNPKLLWRIYYLLNFSLLSFVVFFYFSVPGGYNFISYAALFLTVFLFLIYCRKAYVQRIRRSVDEQMRLSLLSAAMMALPLVLLAAIIILLSVTPKASITLVLSYGFLIFFGWLTAIILGMTFKTLPFIVWNKVYHLQSAKGKTPNPKELFHHRLFNWMSIFYIAGLIIFCTGIFFNEIIILKTGAALLVATAFLYNVNVIKILWHKPKTT